MSERMDESRNRAIEAPATFGAWTNGGVWAIAAAIVYYADVVRGTDPVSFVQPLTSEEQIQQTKQ